MNAVAMGIMSQFLAGYPLKEWSSVLEVGSMNLNGSYRELFPISIKYTGVDIEAGLGVDIVLREQYTYPFPSDFFDMVICGQTLEHVEDVMACMKEMARVLIPGGVVFVCVPWKWPWHRYPLDCWRILPDGISWLFRNCGIDIIDIRMHQDVAEDEGHTIGIGRKQI